MIPDDLTAMMKMKGVMKGTWGMMETSSEDVLWAEVFQPRHCCHFGPVRFSLWGLSCALQDV